MGWGRFARRLTAVAVRPIDGVSSPNSPRSADLLSRSLVTSDRERVPTNAACGTILPVNEWTLSCTQCMPTNTLNSLLASRLSVGRGNRTMHDSAITPSNAVEQYLDAREYELADASIQNMRYRLKRFVEWTDRKGFTDMRELTGRHCEQYKLSRVSDDLAPITIQQQLQTLRVFLKWCESQEYVKPGIADLVRIPAVSKAERTRDDAISAVDGRDILRYYQKYEYASRHHVVFYLAWHTGARLGSLRALDVDDLHIEHHDGEPDVYLTIRHRPETGTPLKLKEMGERNISIVDPDLVDALQDYIDRNRDDVTDDYGRCPLISTKQGRASKNSIRYSVYRATQPCQYRNECPYDREESECEARSNVASSSKCPSTVGPHAIRRSAITAHLNADVPKEIASERMAVSVDTLEDHYDVRSDEQKRNRRRRYLSDLGI